MHSPDCRAPENIRLLFLHKSGEPPEHPDHQIAYDHDVIDACSSCAGATLERLRHDCFDFEEVWNQYEWFELTPDDGARLSDLAARCPRPLDPSCGCALHESLRISARTLPSSSWSVVFEGRAHRHLVSLTSGDTPEFRLVAAGQPPAAEPHSLRDPATDRRARWLLLAVWPGLFALSLTVYYRNVELSWRFDALATVAMVPASFLAAVMLVALVKVIREAGASASAEKPRAGPR